MKRTLEEQIDRIKKLSVIIDEQENSAGIKSYGHQVDRNKGCGTQGSNYVDVSNSKEVRQANKEEERQNQQYEKDKLKSFNDKFNWKTNVLSEPLSKEEKQSYGVEYNSFLVKNPSFKEDASKYRVDQRYSFLKKSIVDQWMVRKLNVIFNKPNPYENIRISVDDLYKMIQDSKINGFDNFVEMYKNNFPGVSYPDNPHKFD